MFWNWHTYQTKPTSPNKYQEDRHYTATQAGCWRQGEEKEFRHSDSSHWPSTAHQLVWKGSWELGQTKQTQQIVWRRNWSQVWQHQKYSVYCEPMVWGGAVIRDYWPHRWSPQYRCPPVAHFSICSPLYHHHLHLLLQPRSELGPKMTDTPPGGQSSWVDLSRWAVKSILFYARFCFCSGFTLVTCDGRETVVAGSVRVWWWEDSRR